MSFFFRTNRLNLVSEENFGAAPPMGSVNDIKITNTVRYSVEWLCYNFSSMLEWVDTEQHVLSTDGYLSAL